MTKKRKISKKEAEEIRLLTIDLVEKASLKDIYVMSAYQKMGRKLLINYVNSKHKWLQSITGWVLLLLTKLYSFYYPEEGHR